jgi:PAS domain S-box-containing protein
MFEEDFSGKIAKLAAIVDSSEDAIISKTLDGIITSWNKAAERMFGYSETEAVGKHISLIIPADRLQEEDMIISRLREGGRIDHFQTIRVSNTGKQLTLSLSISPLKNDQGKIIGAAKIARDITKQKEDEKLIAQYVSRLELINSIAKTLAGELNTESILQKTTDATTKLCGAAFGAFFYNKIDSRGESYLLYTLSGAPREAFDKFGMPRNTEVFDMTFSGKGILRSDDITKDYRYGNNSPHKGMPAGHLPVVSYLAVPVFSQAGVVIGGLFFGHPEVGIFKQEHEVLVEAVASQAGVALDNAKLYHEVKSLNARKDEFIAFTSHELKTPLTTLTGYIQLLGQMPGMVEQLIPKMEKQAHRLSAIISDLLDISRIQADKLELDLSKVSLWSLVKESVESAKQLSSFHEIECELPAEDLFLKIDNGKINQVLVNILSNAIKYSPDSKKIIVRADRIGDEVKISVQDYGIGISKEDIGQIFDQFYRARKHETNVEGLGLGLYLCKEFVEAHHGKILAESSEGNGTTVEIVLPINLIE